MEELVYVLLNGERGVAVYKNYNDALHDFFILEKTQPNSHVQIEPINMFDRSFLDDGGN